MSADQFRLVEKLPPYHPIQYGFLFFFEHVILPPPSGAKRRKEPLPFSSAGGHGGADAAPSPANNPSGSHHATLLSLLHLRETERQRERE